MIRLIAVSLLCFTFQASALSMVRYEIDVTPVGEDIASFDARLREFPDETATLSAKGVARSSGILGVPEIRVSSD